MEGQSDRRRKVVLSLDGRFATFKLFND